MNIIFWILIGGAAGWIADRVMKTNNSMLINIIVGVIGASIGGWVFRFLGLYTSGGLIGSLITAVVGALILLYGLKMFKGR